MVTIKTTKEIIKHSLACVDIEDKFCFEIDSNTFKGKWALVEEQKKEYDKRINYILKQLPIQGLGETLKDLRKVLFGDNKDIKELKKISSSKPKKKSFTKSKVRKFWK